MKMKEVTIQILYRSAVSGSLILQRASFPLKGRKPHEVVLDWLEEIHREMFVGTLEQIICNGEDITGMIKEMDTSKGL